MSDLFAQIILVSCYGDLVEIYLKSLLCQPEEALPNLLFAYSPTYYCAEDTLTLHMYFLTARSDPGNLQLRITQMLLLHMGVHAFVLLPLEGRGTSGGVCNGFGKAFRVLETYQAF